MELTAPESHIDLLTTNISETIVTLMPDSTPQATVVWVDWKDDHLWASMDLTAQKYRNLQRDPRATFTAIDPQNALRYVEIRAQMVEADEKASPDWIDTTSQRYTGKPYYGNFEPEEAKDEPYVVVKFKPNRIRTVG